MKIMYHSKASKDQKRSSPRNKTKQLKFLGIFDFVRLFLVSLDGNPDYLNFKNHSLDTR